MSIYSFTSRIYKGLTVCYRYIAEKAQVSYDTCGAFNGGTPAILDITIEDVKAGEVSILDYISGLVLEGLQDEVAEEIRESC
jgi:hypothetical protein